ncbi:MAG: hypothetical protein FWG40_07335 [Peptococcaceae bacterium]|nr:hypothetical protein [Peptococcaceae bacterium]
MYKKSLVIIALVAVALTIIIIGNSAKTTTAAETIDKNMSKIMDSIDMAVKNNSDVATSSNPYSYIKDNPYFDSIVQIGTPALPEIRERINKSTNNGLEEYVLAIAAERIAKIDLKDDAFLWSTAKEWVPLWDQHLKDIKNNVEEITSSAIDEKAKTEKLAKLGTPAIPFIMDKIEYGHKELVEVLEILLEGNNGVEFDLKEIPDIEIWVSENKNLFQDLRELVESAAKL